jgi:carbamoyltransferase
VIVLGFTFWSGSHDSAAAIVRDGELVAAAEEERFTRKKHDGSVPLNAIDYCLSAAGVEMRQVDVIAYPDRPFRTGRDSQMAEMRFKSLTAMVRQGHARKRSMVHKVALDAANRVGLARNAGMNPLVAEAFAMLEKRYGGLPPVKYYGHHLAHAAAAYLTSGFDDAAVVTLDGRGGPLSGATWHGHGAVLEKLEEAPYTNSLGWFYRDCTRFAGLGDFGEGKLMGLAPYGTASKKIESVSVSLDTTGSEWFQYKRPPTLVDFPRREDDDILSEPWPDFAAAVQHALERGYERAVTSAVDSSGARRLCVGGGVAMNCSANGHLLGSQIAEYMWAFPASGDAGLSVGAALLAARDFGDMAARRIESPYWGPAFDDDACESALRAMPNVSYYRSDKIAAEVAGFLAEGKVVGWFQGRMELGPRALGNRSILADPRTVAMRDKVNRVKGREMWRPLAPSILAERTSEWFEIVPPNAFMLFASQAREIAKEKAPAIVHVDGSARPQPVTKKLNPHYYDLIMEFEKLTGVPVLLNTSFNSAGEPIVCSPEDAVETFCATDLDLLVLGPFIARKTD